MAEGLPECPYGASCYRKNPHHLKSYYHPDGISVTARHAADSSDEDDDSSNLPPCKFGARCYRKNILHFAEYSHPASHPSNSSSRAGSGRPHRPTSSRVQKNTILSEDLELVKDFSEMTVDEQQELIRQALVEKQRLKKQLEQAQKMVKDKDHRLKNLTKKLNHSGLPLMEGEAEALKKTTTTYFPLLPERAYKEGSASQFHFRLAESQFYRLVTPGQQIRVTKVEYVVSPAVVKKFRAYQDNLRKQRGVDLSHAVLGFHGTNEQNIQPICENGFKVPGDAGFQHKTDSGWYGAGVYFSEYPSYSMGYIQGGSKLMLCQVLPGKVYQCPGRLDGSRLQAGYDSHMSPCKNEMVIFNSAAILPCYIVHFSNISNPAQLQLQLPSLVLK